MPELPEVQTTVNYLKKQIVGCRLTDVWTDSAKLIKKPKSFQEFKAQLVGAVIEGISRRGKNIIFHLSGQKTLLIHQKMTGHLLVGKWQLASAKSSKEKFSATAGKWVSLIPGPLKEDRLNDYLRLVFWLDSPPQATQKCQGKQLALSDLRKFAKIELFEKEIPQDPSQKTGLPELDKLGPDPFDKAFSYQYFKEQLRTRSAAIKTVLMNQSVVAGIGNIYSDEILWAARVHPQTLAKDLKEAQLKAIYQQIRPVLKKALELEGTSVGDYRKPDGTAGGYQKARKAYGRQGKPCPRCGAALERLKVNQRSAHFCPKCQPSQN